MSKHQRSSVGKIILDQSRLDQKLTRLKAVEPQSELIELFTNNEVLCVLISPNENFIVAGQKGGEILVHKISHHKTDYFAGHSDDVKSIAITSNSETVVTGGYDGKVCVWDLSNFSLLAQFENHGLSVLSVVISSNDEYAISSSLDKTVFIWNLREPSFRKLHNFCQLF